MKTFAVAPMMEWTDRHCRALHRQFSRRALLYTEMVVAEAILRGDRDRLLGFSTVEHPVAVQLGGSEPDRLAAAAGIAAGYGYDEINLNIGCPSERVRTGAFGACLMREPVLVGELVAAMKSAVSVPVTVKCRIGVDDQDDEALDVFAEACFSAGADGLWVHARKAWLKGLSPKDNRSVPPLDYARVERLKKRWPDAFIGINGGIDSLDTAEELLERLDGVMIGRAVYHDPALLGDVDRRLFGQAPLNADPFQVVGDYLPYVEDQLAAGARLHHLTRHMLGLFHGRPGARKWRQILTADSTAKGAGLEVIERALRAVRPPPERARAAASAAVQPAAPQPA